jgi:hypothetical protein
MASAVNPGHTSSEAYDEIEESESDVWTFDMHFTDRPEANLGPCSDDDNREYWAYPEMFKFDVQIGDNESADELYLSDPDPNSGESNSNTDEDDKILDILSDSYGNIYTDLGVAVGDYIISNDNVIADQHENGGRYTIEVDTHGDYGDLPREENDEARAAQVSLRVNNDYPVGTNHTVKFLPEYTFTYAKLDPITCDCMAWFYTDKTTVPIDPGYAVFESI